MKTGRKRRFFRIRELWRGRKRGSSLVEVMVASVIVVLMATLFARTMQTSTRILSQSRRMISRGEEFRAYYYKAEQEAGKDVKGVQLQMEDDPSLVLTLNGTTLKSCTDSEGSGMTRYYFYCRGQEDGE